MGGEENLRMISFVAMDRLVENKRATDAAYRKQTADRPRRSDAQRLTDDELVAKLRKFGIEMDRHTMEHLCGKALSAEEITLPLLQQITFRTKREEMETDWVWISISSLWQRWFPDVPSFEALDDKMQAGYRLSGSRAVVEACRVWLAAWTDVLQLMDKGGIQSMDEFDERFRGTQSLFNWIQDLESELWNAGLKDAEFLTARIALCKEALRRFPSTDGLVVENFRRGLAESYFELGETDRAETLFREWLDADPRWGWGWIGWSDCYGFTPSEARRDLRRAEQILRDGLAVDAVRHRADLSDRLADICEEQGRGEEAAEHRREAKRTSASGIGSRSVSPALTEPSPATLKPKPKVGRNEPCPCGSGKKYKKCCGG